MKEVVKQQIWPFLKQHGFSKFTTRVAYRTVGQVVQVVEVSSLNWADQKIAPAPIGAFDMQVGLFWPLLSVKRENARSTPLTIFDRQILTWLAAPNEENTSVEAALDSLKQVGFPWLSIFEDPKAAMSVLGQSDWEIFRLMPMTRNIGAYGSAKRLLLVAFFAFLGHNVIEAADYLKQAAYVIEHKELPSQQTALRVSYRNLRELIHA